VTLSKGVRFGPYEIVAPIGAGGMGEVYRARDTRLRRDVAIKVLPEGVVGDNRRLHRFEQEACAASALNHPNILTVYDFESSDRGTYLVTELLVGESLREIVSRGPVPCERAIDIAIQIAKGLTASHEAGIIHRDLKPENVFVTRDGIAKILDFGLASVKVEETEGKVATDAATMVKTSEGALLGTVGYMAPEQVRGEKADARTDLFAFGCLFYEMLTGQRAFGRETRAQTLAAILDEEPSDPMTFDCELSVPLRHILQHCLEKESDRRFQAARDLQFALEEASGSGESVPAARLPGRGLRRRLPILLFRAAIVVALVLATWAILKPRPSPVEVTPVEAATIDSLAVLPLANLSGDATQDYFSDGMTEALIAELAKLRALKVISRTSVMRFKGTTKPLPEIARELGVRGVIEGSVLRDDNDVRITVQLIDGRDDRHLWAESYTRPARDILRLQGEVAKAIARQVNIVVSPEEERALATAREVDPEAHRMLLEAMELGKRGASQLSDTQRIGELVDRAIEIDPGYALAHVFRAQNIWFLAGTGYEAATAVCPRAHKELGLALALDPDLFEARLLDAGLRWGCHSDFEGAEREYLRLISEAPGNAGVHDWYAYILAVAGRYDEALEHYRRAFELDPLNDWIGGHGVWILRLAGRLPESLALARKVLAFSPDSMYPLWEYGNSQLAAGDYDGALESYLARKVGRPDMNFKVGVLRARMGESGKARAVLDYLLEKRRNRYVPASQIADIYANLGERDKAFEWLETARTERDTFLFLADLIHETDFDPIRDDPRFSALEEKMRLRDTTSG